MASLIPGFEYDVFISYRQKDNKHDGWVTKFVENLKGELESTFKEDISIYFDENPHDRLQDTHNVDKSLEGKLKCLIFIPILSQTYCDPNSYAWQNEFIAFNKFASEDRFGKNIRLRNGNYAGRILPIRIHDLEPEDIKLFEKESGSVLRAMDFVFKTSSGVNRPLKVNEDHPNDNVTRTFYGDQINKTANAIKEIVLGLRAAPDLNDKRKTMVPPEEVDTRDANGVKISRRTINRNSRQFLILFILLFLCGVGAAVIYRIINYGNQTQMPSQLDKSIAVLPFVNDSPDKDNEYFCNGMMEEILNQLQKIRDLKVKARTTSEKYRNLNRDITEIGKELKVSLIMEGSVRKVGDDLRITAQLIDAKTGDHLWSETYDGKYTTEIFDFQSGVAKKVAASLNAVITPQETKRIDTKPTSDIRAFDLCSRSFELTRKWRFSNDSNDLKLALNLINEALIIQPEYLDALNYKAQVFTEAGKYDSALFYQRKVIGIDPQYKEGLVGLGVTYMYSNQPDSAFKYLQMAVEQNPNEPWGNLALGQVYAIFKHDNLKYLYYANKAYDLAGDSWSEICYNMAMVYYGIGENQKALSYLKKAISQRSEYELILKYDLILSEQGKYAEAIHFTDSICNLNAYEQHCCIIKFYLYTLQDEFKKAEEYYTKAQTEGYKIKETDRIYLAYLYGATGRNKQADLILRNSIKQNNDLLRAKLHSWEWVEIKWRLATIHAILEEKNMAMKYLSETGNPGMFGIHFNINTFKGFDNLRNDPEFRIYLKRIEHEQDSVSAQVKQMELRGEIDL